MMPREVPGLLDVNAAVIREADSLVVSDYTDYWEQYNTTQGRVAHGQFQAQLVARKPTSTNSSGRAVFQ